MGLPNLEITFRTRGASFIQRSEKGTLAVILKDSKSLGAHTLYSITDIPQDLTDKNKEYLERAFLGYVNVLKKLELFVIKATDKLEDGLRHFEVTRFDYLVGYPDLGQADGEKIAAWVKTQRQNAFGIKTVLPNLKADTEGVINFTAEDMAKLVEKITEETEPVLDDDGKATGETITTKKTTMEPLVYKTAEYCSRVAGLILGTPMKMSCTYAPFPELVDVKRFTNDELDEKIDNGEFVLFHDGEQVLVGRGVNSLVTTTEDKGDSFKKIKIVEAIDMIRADLLNSWRRSYVGKYSNSYDDKCLLIVAIQGYLAELERLGIVEEGSSTVGINIEKQRTYLMQNGVDIEDMTEQEIRQADTGSHVFLQARAVILDSMEDIDLDFLVN